MAERSVRSERAGTLVETVAGPVGIGWTARGLGRVILSDLSHDDEGITSKRVAATARSQRAGEVAARLETDGFPVVSAATGAGAAWVDRIGRHLAGDAIAFDDLPLDLDAASPFARRVYAAAQRIPRGETWTYARLGAALGTASGASASRAVGTALGKNPVPIVVPCHRIVAAGSIGGFTSPGGLSTKAALLAAEGGSLDDAEHSVARRLLARADPALAPIVRRWPCTLPIRPKGALFRTLVRAIAGQQLSTKAAATIFGRLEALMFDRSGAEPSHVATSGDVSTPWPTSMAQRLAHAPVSALRSVGLSEAKARSVVDLAEHVASGALDLEGLARAPDRAVIERLVAVRGIGRWTVQMLLIFELGRSDVLPTGDLGIRNGVQKIYAMKRPPTVEEMLARAERWRPFRSVASYYLWRSLDA